jgi:hypothetical protein
VTTIIRRKRTSRLQIGPYKRHELLTGEIRYPVRGYTGYGDGVGTDLTAFISAEMRADWEANRDELTAFWKSGKHTTPDVFSDSLPWLFVRGRADELPWAAVQLEKRER